MLKVIIAVLFIGSISGAVYYFAVWNKHEVHEVVKAEVKTTDAGTTPKKKKKKNLHISTLPAIDSLVIHKAGRELLAFSKNKLAATYHVSLGPFPVGDKEYEGDGKTPEGHYFINGKNPNSLYHKNLGVSYPNSQDIEQAKAIGKRTGGDIKIHGLPKGYEGWKKKFLAKDWTAGCIALTNEEIDELYQSVKVGSPVLITP
jgi:murein L,D-transpeptidase YafK